MFDISIIRPEMRLSDFKFRGVEMPPERLETIRKGLRTLHTLETMAVNIYKFQITKKANDLNLQIIAAMHNEMTHLQDFQSKLFEYGFKPSKFRFVYWTVGFIFGFFSRLMGRKAVLKTGIWVETKAVHHYGELLKDIEWDEDTRKIVEKDQADEFGHIKRWESFLK
ncbi:MAG: demethoxyubiquinone hydroxylase family protein [Candidatus Aminicenantes bacterium]